MTPDGDSGEPAFVISDRAVESRFTCFFLPPFVLVMSYSTKNIKHNLYQLIPLNINQNVSYV